MTAAAVRVFWTSLTTIPVLLPVLLLRRTLLKSRRAKHCYLLWLLLCLRLILPFEFPLSHPPVTVTLPDTIPILSVSVSEGFTPDSTNPQAALMWAASTVTPLDWLSLIWLIGTALSLLLHTGAYCLARRRLLADAQADTCVQALAEQLGNTVPILRSTVTTPLTLGLFHPVILLPQNTDSENLEMILRHEICHIRRRDIWYKVLFLLCACVHWFNPLVWMLAKTAGETVELCCDEDVVAGQDVQFKRRYGQCLLCGAAEYCGVVLSTSFGNSEMKGRLMNLFSEKKKGCLLLCVLCGFTLCLGNLVGCQASAAPSHNGISANQAIISTPPASSDLPTEIPAQEAPVETVWPVEEHYTLSATYGDRHHPVTGKHHNHSGVDIPAEQGTLVLAALDGTIRDCRFDDTLGNCVELTHADGCTSLYGCLSEICVKIGDSVLAGQVIGKVGSTGQATGHHLHFEVRNQDGHSTDPLCGYPTKEFFHHS